MNRRGFLRGLAGLSASAVLGEELLDRLLWTPKKTISIPTGIVFNQIDIGYSFVFVAKTLDAATYRYKILPASSVHLREGLYAVDIPVSVTNGEVVELTGYAVSR